MNNIVLVHGGFVDGSGWEGVYKSSSVTATKSASSKIPRYRSTDDVAVTKRVIATHGGPVILVGHSYGGAVITEAGNDPKVAGLVYIAAFALDKGESVSSLIKTRRPALPCRRYCRRRTASCSSTRRSFPLHSLPTWIPDKAEFMADSQVPWGVGALTGERSVRPHGGPSRVGIWSPPTTR